MGITHKIKLGTTEAQTFQAKADGAAPNLTGASLSLEVATKRGQPVTVTGTVAWSDASTATWSYTPNGQLTKSESPYAVRLKVDDGSSVVYFPTGDSEPDQWYIVDP